MARVTSKLQITVPKALAGRYGIRPGDEVRFEEAGETIRMVPAGAGAPSDALDREARLRLFDAATERQRARQPVRSFHEDGHGPGEHRRGWTRDELYERGSPNTD